MTYNGWKNRQTWSVALWIGNDEPLYRSAVAFARSYKGRSIYRDFAEHVGLEGNTPDGCPWLGSMLSYSELNAMMRDLIA